MSNRSLIISEILRKHKNAFFVISNGLSSREASHFDRQSRCLYLLHAMGEALSVGIGISQIIKDMEIVVIDGDGNALMGMSSWCLMPIKNLKYYILKNGCYETTGGQEISDFPILPKWCNVISISVGKDETPNPPHPEEIWKDATNWLKVNKHIGI